MARPEGVVLVGKKPAMNYVIACITAFNAGHNTISIKARGRNISKAVSVLEVLKRFDKSIEVKKIDIGTEEITRQDGTRALASVIDITVSKPKS